MLEAPPLVPYEAPPADVVCRRYLEIAELTPVLVRKTAQDPWYKQPDLQLAAADVFSESDGVHSFFEISSVADLAAVGTFMSRGGDKPFKRAAYFCALPLRIIESFALPVEHAATESACPPLNDMHRHVSLDPTKRLAVFVEIQNANLFNFRVDKRTMYAVRDVLQNRGCLDYSAGPCAVCAPATQ